MAQQDRPDVLPARSGSGRPAELRLICFCHQFDVIIVFHFYVRMSDNP